MNSRSSKRICRHTGFDSSTELVQIQVGQGSQDHESRSPVDNSSTELLQVGQGSQDHESRSPMDKIPPEMLASIIELAISTDLDRPFPMWPEFFDPWAPTRPYPAEDLNHYMLVSRRWRDVIREFPKLWNTIMIDQPSRRMKDPLADCLNRSGRTGLKAFVAMSSSSLEDDIAAIAAHSSRLKMLYLSSESSDCLRGALSQFRLAAPVLQRLVIDLECMTPVQMPILFEGHMPSLVDLSLRGPVLLSGNAFSGLRHLAIDHFHRPWPAGMSASESFCDFIAFLRGSHELEELRLWDTSTYLGIFEDLFVAPPEADQIIFTKLRRLSFGFCEPWHVKAFLRLFQLPAQTCLYVLSTTQLRPRCSLFDTLPDDISALANLHNITKLELLLESTTSHAIGIGPASAFYIKTDPLDPVMQHPGSYHGSTFLDLAHARKLNGIQDIKELWLRRSDMGGLFFNAGTAFATTFASARSLSKLVLLLPRTYLETVLYALGAGFDIDNPGELVCPALEHLTVCSQGFVSVMSLTDCVAFRAKKGVPLRELVLYCKREEYVPRYIHRTRQELGQFVTKVKVMCGLRVPALHFPVPPEYVNQDVHTDWEDWR